MKTFILTVTLSLTAFAGQENYGVGPFEKESYNPEAIYNALKVKAIQINPGVAGVSRFQKSVGGLTCIRSKVIYPNAPISYTCEVNQSYENFKAIYKAIEAEEIALNPGAGGAVRLQKSVGGLTCEKSKSILPNARLKYTCEISE